MKICLHNFAVVAVFIQICMVYFFTSISKLGNIDWRHGKAVLMTSQVNHYSLPFISENVTELAVLFVFINFLVLLFQLLFPIMIWIKKTRKIFILSGVLIHLYIAFVMGLLSFGIIMIICYVYFWPNSEEDVINWTQGRRK